MANKLQTYEIWIKRNDRDTDMFQLTTINLRKEQVKDVTPQFIREMWGHALSNIPNDMEIEVRLKLEKEWRQREQYRLSERGGYLGMKYRELPKLWLDTLTPIEDHYCHPSVDDNKHEFVAFTESPDKGERDIQTPMRAGKYIKKFYPHLTNDEVRAYASALQAGQGVQMTDDPDLAAEIYENGPQSCMQYKGSHWGYHHYPNKKKEVRHPVAAYFGGDLMLAWMGRSNAAEARCLVWPEKKLYGRLYGAHERLKQALESAGYKCSYGGGTTFPGARVNIIELSDNLIAYPYIDGGRAISYDKKKDQVFFGDVNEQENPNNCVPAEVKVSESGRSEFHKEASLRCYLSGSLIKDQDYIEAHVGGNSIRPMLSKYIQSHGFHLCEDGYYSNYIARLKEDGIVKTIHLGTEENRERIQNMVMCMDNIYRNAEDCVRHRNGRYIEKTDDLIYWKGFYYSNEADLFAYYPQLIITNYTSTPVPKNIQELVLERVGGYLDKYNYVGYIERCEMYSKQKP